MLVTVSFKNIIERAVTYVRMGDQPPPPLADVGAETAVPAVVDEAVLKERAEYVARALLCSLSAAVC